MVLDGLRSYVQLASGLTDVTRERALAAAKSLLAQGESVVPGTVKSQVGSLTDDLIATSKANRTLLTNLVRLEVERSVGRLGLVSSAELESSMRRAARLEKRVADLEYELRQARTGPAAKKAAEKAPAKKTAKKAAKKTAKKTAKKAAKKAPAKKAATASVAAPPTAAPESASPPTAAPESASPPTAAPETSRPQTASAEAMSADTGTGPATDSGTSTTSAARKTGARRATAKRAT
ncbi:MAG: hypothetical protein ACXV2J_11615 [Actinomycetes bacterium]